MVTSIHGSYCLYLSLILIWALMEGGASKGKILNLLGNLGEALKGTSEVDGTLGCERALNPKASTPKDPVILQLYSSDSCARKPLDPRSRAREP